MDIIEKWIEIFKIQITDGWFTILGWIIGIISGVIQIKSYQEQKHFEKDYKDVFEQAKRNRKGKFTEEQIRNLDMQLERLQKNVRRKVFGQFTPSISLAPNFRKLFIVITIAIITQFVAHIVLSIINPSTSDEIFIIAKNTLATSIIFGTGMLIGLLAGKIY